MNFKCFLKTVHWLCWNLKKIFFFFCLEKLFQNNGIINQVWNWNHPESFKKTKFLIPNFSFPLISIVVLTFQEKIKCLGWGSNSRPSDYSALIYWLWDWRAAYCATETHDNATTTLSKCLTPRDYQVLYHRDNCDKINLISNYNCSVCSKLAKSARLKISQMFSLQRGNPFPLRKWCPKCDNKLHLQFLGSEECGVLLHCHYSQVHSDPEC